MNTTGYTYLVGSSGEKISERQKIVFRLDNWVLKGEASFACPDVPACGAIVEGPYGEVVAHEHIKPPISGPRWRTIECPWTLSLDGLFREKPQTKKRWRK